MKPKRLQLSRKRGWKLPPGAVNVARPSRWGNPYSVAEFGRELAVSNYRRRLVGLLAIAAVDLSPLRGRDLACWCRPGDICHADVLLELANSEPTP